MNIRMGKGPGVQETAVLCGGARARDEEGHLDRLGTGVNHGFMQGTTLILANSC